MLARVGQKGVALAVGGMGPVELAARNDHVIVIGPGGKSGRKSEVHHREAFFHG